MSQNTQQTPYSPFTSNMRKPGHQDYPADLLKFNAWTTPVEDFTTAVNILLQKKLVLGEPAVVPFNFTHADGTVTLELAFAIGSADINHPYIKCSITNDIINEAIIVAQDEDGNPVYKTLAEILNTYVTKNEAQDIINQGVITAVKNESIANELAEELAKTDVINNLIKDHLRWKPLSELIENI
jgi:hypothetical protein